MAIRELGRDQVNIHMVAGDVIQLLENNEVLLSKEIDRSMIIDEVLLFESDAEVFGKPAIGGAFLEKV